MSVTVLDFLPIYPDIEDEDFYQQIYNKREFRELELEKNEAYDFSDYLPNQKIISRFLSPYTLYNNLLLYHEMGTGKTCAAVGVAETLKSAGYKGCLYFAKGQGLINNFVNELIYKCTNGEYLPGEYNSEGEKNFRENAQIKNFYSMHTYQTFAKNFIGNENIYDNYIIILDEIHNVITQKSATTNSDYSFYFNFLHKVKNCKILLLSGTPIRDKIDTFTPIMNLILPLDKQINQRLNLDELNDLVLNNLKAQIKGYVSYLSAPKSDVKRSFKTNFETELINNNFYSNSNTQFPFAKKFTLFFEKMSPWQTAKYLANGGDKLGSDVNNSLIDDIDIDNKQDAAYSGIRQLSLFVAPPTKIKIDFEFTNFNFLRDIRKINGTKMENKTKNKNYSNISNSFDYYFIDGFDKIWQDSNNDIAQFRKKWLMFLQNKFSNTNIINPPSIEYLSEKIESNNLTGDSIVNFLKLEWKLINLAQCSIIYYNSIRTILDGIKKGKKIFIYNSFINNVGIYLFYHILTKIFGFQNALADAKTPSNKRILVLTADTMQYSSQIKAKLNEFNSPENKNGQLISVIIGSKIISEGYTFKNIQIIDVQTPGWNYAEISQAIARGYRINSHNDLINSGVDVDVNIYQRVNIPDLDLSKSIDLLMYEFSANKDISIKKIERIVKIASFDCSLTKNRNYNQIEDGSRECDYMNCYYDCEGDVNIDEPINNATYNIYYSNQYKSIVKSKIKNVFKIYNKLYLDDLISILNLNDDKFLLLDVLNDIISNNDIIYTKYGLINFLREKDNYYFKVNNIFLTNDEIFEYYSKYVSLYKYNTINMWVENNITNTEIDIITKISTSSSESEIIRLFNELNDKSRELFKVYAKNAGNKTKASTIINKMFASDAVENTKAEDAYKIRARELQIDFYGKNKLEDSAKSESKKSSQESIVFLENISTREDKNPGKSCLTVNKDNKNPIKPGMSHEYCIDQILNRNSRYKDDNTQKLISQGIDILNEWFNLTHKTDKGKIRDINNIYIILKQNGKNILAYRNYYIKKGSDDIIFIENINEIDDKDEFYNVPFYPTKKYNIKKIVGSLTTKDICNMIMFYLKKVNCYYNPI